MGITEDGHKEILDFVTIPNEGSHSWKDVLENLKSRGVGNPKLFITDGLQGMPEAIKAYFQRQNIKDVLYISKEILLKTLESKTRKKYVMISRMFITLNLKKTPN